MAGAITHLLVAEDAGDLAKTYSPELGEILSQYRPFLLLGSVAPDLPYLDLLSPKQKVWADQMHYVSTNTLPRECAVRIGTSNLRGTQGGDAQLAWLAGYIAHCIADATIHPIVQAIVGPYHGHEEEHRRCEMFQDSLLFTEVKECDLRGSHYVDILKQLTPTELGGHILDLWHDGLTVVYADTDPNPETAAWYKSYELLLDGAVDGDLLARLSRPFKKVQELLYKDGPALCAQFPREVECFYKHVPIPSSSENFRRFEECGYQYAILNVLPVWKAMMQDIDNAHEILQGGREGSLIRILKNWNLDTGEDQDSPDRTVTCWAKNPFK